MAKESKSNRRKRSRKKKAESQKNWRHKARLAIVALHLGDATLTQDMCQLRPDPIQRTLFIEEFPRWHADVTELAELAERVDDGPFRSGIGAAIGSIPLAALTTAEQIAWKRLLTEWYQNKPDTGSHSAASWVLRQWNLELPKIVASKQHCSRQQFRFLECHETLLHH